MDKNTLCYCTPNLHKFVYQAPLCGRVLATKLIIIDDVSAIYQ